MKDYTYASIVPLIGGETIAMENVFGKRPEYILSYSAFGANDSQLLHYYNHEVPYHVIDEGNGRTDYVDVVNTVCPCAGLSMLNVHANADAEANNWMLESSKYVLENIKPRVFWGENAPGLYGSMGKPVVEKLQKIAEANGYTLLLYKTKSTLHGIGQVRGRSFYFFFKEEERTPIIDYYSRPMEPIEEIIRNAYVSDDDPMNETVNKTKPSENPMYRYVLEVIEGGITHEEFYKKIEASTNPQNWIEKSGHTYEQVSEWLSAEGYDRQAASALRMHHKLKSGGNIMKRGVEFGKGHTSAFVGHFATNLAHPDEDRYITIREALAIMKMPSDFQLQGGRKCLNMICQNVPVCTATDMASSVLNYLNGELDSVDAKLVRQSNLSRTLDYERTPHTLEQFLV